MTVRPATPARATFVDYYRCPTELAAVDTSPDLSATSGYFRFEGTCCYGRLSGADASPQVTDEMAEVGGAPRLVMQDVVLPFDLAEVVTNLREERYRHNGYPLLNQMTSGPLAQALYYSCGP